MAHQYDEDGNCIKSGLSPRSCAHCRNHHDIADPYEDLAIKHFRTAKFDGRCNLNRAHPIAAGDQIGLGVIMEEGKSPEDCKEVGWVCGTCCDRARG